MTISILNVNYYLKFIKDKRSIYLNNEKNISKLTFNNKFKYLILFFI